MAHPKQRLDTLLVARGLAESREIAQALIRAGEVTVDGQVFDKPGMPLREDVAIQVRVPLPYVGRGGYKLAAALDAFGVSPDGLACLDVGASTGGFTDVLLQRGARRVYAVDVGRSQLAWKLRSDPRVVNLEQTDIRALGDLPEPIQLVVVDVAFISLRLVLPAIRRRVDPTHGVIALIKPQFEAGRQAVGRGGIVRDPAVRDAVVAGLLEWARSESWTLLDSPIPSPILGTEGNQEYLVRLWPEPGTRPAPTGSGEDRRDLQ